MFWLIGSVCIFFGTLILTSMEPGSLGTDTVSTLLGWLVSFVLITVGGMFWISIMHMEEQ